MQTRLKYTTWMIGGNTGKRITQVSDKTSFTVHQYRMVGVSHGNVSVMDYTGVALDRLYCYICTGWSGCHMETDNTGVGLQRCRITQVSDQTDITGYTYGTVGGPSELFDHDFLNGLWIGHQ